jgi:protein-S-isoprenylcysteine O-methyltransferase Ste14
MEKVFARVEELAGHIKEYVNIRIDAVKLHTAEKTSKAIAGALAFVVVIQLLALFAVFASIALAFAFAEWTGKIYWGFLIVAGIYLLLGVIIWLAKEQLLRIPIMNALLRQMHAGKTEEDDDDEEN